MSFEQYTISPWLTPVRVVSVANVAGTYNNGTLNNGVGATLTISASSLTVDSVVMAVGDRLLLQAQTNANENGIYVVLSIGSTVVLQRAFDMQCAENMKAGQYVSVAAGTVNKGSAFVLTETLPARFGIDNMVWTASPLNSALGTAAAKAASDNAEASLASVSGTTTSGDFVQFDDTAGSIQDTGISPSNAAKTKVVMANGTVIANHIAVFTDTAGTVDKDAATAINGGNLQAGLSGTAGKLSSFPATVTTGKLSLTGVSNSGDFEVQISNRSHGQATVYSIADVGAATGSLLNCVVAADPGSNLISFDITVGQAALATGGHVALITSSGSKQYKIRQLFLNSGGTNFSGGGGDRLGQVSDGTTVYSLIPAATMQSLTNERWGNTNLPFPAAAAIFTSTAAGANIFFAYSGGTTDYTAGSLRISGLVERVA